MNKHTKLAFILAPLLLVGGYIGSDLYLEYDANKPKIFQLSPQSKCDLFESSCILEAGELQISLTDENGLTKANTSFPVDSVAISLVYNAGNEVIYALNKAGNTQYWQKKTDIRSAISKQKIAEKLRVLVKIKGSMYMTEFMPKTTSVN